MKILKATLSRWSKETFGDLFKQLTIREDIMKIKEQLFVEDPSEDNRMVLQRAQAEFKSLIKERRKRLLLIQNANGEWVDNLDYIATEAISFYHNQFSQESGVVDSILLDHIPERISEDQNKFLCAKPSLEEVKNVVFCIIRCWNIIGADVYHVISSFYESRFVKGRNITENVLLTQELVADIRKRRKPANVIIKLDMAKAYDRLSRRFLVHVVRNMAFTEVYVDMVWRLIANNWYSILINGQSFGFVHSTRGVKQGDPLSPAIFILAAELQRIWNAKVEYKLESSVTCR
ncbi:uncharacterized protein LOC132625607 [Lycium barbarum]|uniref:uncharacterized protein LOC132625607 n=1 Tax=Lycium barbarum TaxID=112863 RepID=UPI00293E8F97|nr:uncharacterized protein LOC132625607 [Lycium barbarum]